MKRPTILCVDDEEIVLVSLKEQLRHAFQEDYDIEVADSGELALDIVKELSAQKVDIPLVIVDQVMSGMKGDELLATIHHLSPGTKKVMLTGHSNAEAVGNAVNRADLYRYIAKPWELDDLLLTVKKGIESYFQEKAIEERNAMLEEAQNKLIAINHVLKRKIEIFNKFVPVQFLKLLTSDKDYVELGQCAERTLSVMFADIHSFTLISEALPLQEVFEFINKFLSSVAPHITKQEGFIDKFVGDAVMALFTDSDNAIQAAIDIQQHILTNENKKMSVPYQIGISVNTGPVMIGTVGEPDHMETTAIGDTVNVASRVENMTKIYKTALLITENTIKNLRKPSRFQIRSIDAVIVKGRQEPLELFEVLDALPADLKEKKLSIVDLFKQARAHYLGHNHLVAKKLFNQCLKLCPEDEVSRIYLSRIEG